jgi:hypothetical protein
MHHGEDILDVGWFGDHAAECYPIAHDYLIVNDGCTRGQHYPFDFRRFRKKDLCECWEVPFKDHTVLLVAWQGHRGLAQPLGHRPDA